MIKPIVITQEEYAEIERMKNEHAEMKDLLNEMKQARTEYIKFSKAVSGIFLDDEGNFSYCETSQQDPYHLHLNNNLLEELFNFYFEEIFLKETGLKVDSSWKFIG